MFVILIFFNHSYVLMQYKDGPLPYRVRESSILKLVTRHLSTLVLSVVVLCGILKQHPDEQYKHK